jgi:hypothetical protein
VTRRRGVGVLDFLKLVRWLDGSPMLNHIEPYRRAILTDVLDQRLPDGRVRYNLCLLGRAKKNWKSADLVLSALFALVANDSPGGNVVYLIANDETQAGDDLGLAKKLIEVSPHLAARVTLKAKAISRRDGKGELIILPAQDVLGSHGKSYIFAGFDEVHGYRSWDLLEALQLDPTRADAQMVLTSYASLYHKPGVPLFDLLAQAKAGADPRLYCSWYAADWTTDPAARDLAPADRANPSRGTWTDPDYLDQQQRRLPAHKFRRLHLNLPGVPSGAAFTAESIMDSVARGIKHRDPEPGVVYVAFLDPSGGSNDAFTCGIAHADADGRAVLDRCLDQGQHPPFDPRKAVERFVPILKAYGIRHLVGDRYAGLTFAYDFERHGIGYTVAELTASQVYEACEAPLNGGRLVFCDDPELESELLGLVWRGGKIDHQPGEHDDRANAALGALLLALDLAAGPPPDVEMSDAEAAALSRIFTHPGEFDVDPADIAPVNFFDSARSPYV